MRRALHSHNVESRTSDMEAIQSLVADNKTACKVAGGIAVSATVAMAIRRWLRLRKDSKARENYPPNTVIVHQLGRGPYAPSMIPAAVKLETYLRMAKIPYQNEHDWKKSSKNKFPWITFNGEDIADSAFCIMHLNNHFKIDLNAWMTTEQRATAVAFQRLIEDDLYWGLLMSRWGRELNVEFLTKALPHVSKFYLKFIAAPLRKQAWAQGMGRHTAEEVHQIVRKDFTALSDYLGNKKFLMGDKPCEEDCALFGSLSQVFWHLPDTAPSDMLKQDFPRLVSYCERMRDTFWPDWVDCTTQGGRAEATR